MSKMSDLGKGDSIEMKYTLIKLQNDKQLLNKKLTKIEAKKKQLLAKCEQQKCRTINRQLEQQLNELRNESIVIEENAKRIEFIINERRDYVNAMKTQLNGKRVDQTIVINNMTSEMDDLCQRFVKITSIQNCQQICDQIKQIEEQIEYKNQKRVSLIQEFRKTVNQLEASEELKTDLIAYKWKDWPIRQRTIALDIFFEQKQLFSQDLDYLKQIE